AILAQAAAGRGRHVSVSVDQARRHELPPRVDLPVHLARERPADAEDPIVLQDHFPVLEQAVPPVLKGDHLAGPDARSAGHGPSPRSTTRASNASAPWPAG